VKLAYDADSAFAARERGELIEDHARGDSFARALRALGRSLFTFGAPLRAAGPPPIVSRQASRGAQSS